MKLMDPVKVISVMEVCSHYVTPYEISYGDCGCCLSWRMDAKETDMVYFKALSGKFIEDLEMK